MTQNSFGQLVQRKRTNGTVGAWLRGVRWKHSALTTRTKPQGKQPVRFTQESQRVAGRLPASRYSAVFKVSAARGMDHDLGHSGPTVWRRHKRKWKPNKALGGTGSPAGCSCLCLEPLSWPSASLHAARGSGEGPELPLVPSSSSWAARMVSEQNLKPLPPSLASHLSLTSGKMYTCPFTRILF